MICLFCNKDINPDLGKKYHLDCFDTEIEETFGNDALIKLLVFKDHLFEHNTSYCPVCNPGLNRGDKWITQTIASGAEKGKRYELRWRLFINMKFLGYDAEKIRELITEFNQNCIPPEKEGSVSYHISYMLRRYLI